jgi:pimeloyl-ACP methyl ester carboxylesterase
MPTVSLRDRTRIFFTEEGSGPVVLLLHGWCCDGNDWAWQVPALQGRYRVLTVDHRGHGRSDAPEGAYPPDLLADDAAEVLSIMAPNERAIVFSHSMGGVVASALAVRRPDLVQSLVLVDPAYATSDEHLAPFIAAMRGSDPHRVASGVFASFYTPETPAFLRTWHARRLAGTPAHVVAGCILGLYDGADAIGRGVVARAYLRRRQVPRLVMVAHDAAADFENSIPTGPGDEIHVVAAGHFLHQQAAPEVNAVVLRWLQARTVDRADGKR